MANEAADLGIPALIINSFADSISYPENGRTSKYAFGFKLKDFLS